MLAHDVTPLAERVEVANNNLSKTFGFTSAPVVMCLTSSDPYFI
jgi:hypothetical protein